MNITLTIPLSAARAMLELAEISSTRSGYGFFPGGDPRCFSPDSDSTPEELERHKLACAAWDRGEHLDSEPAGVSAGDEKSFVHVTLSKFGIGGFSFRNEEMVELAKVLREAIERPAPKLLDAPTHGGLWVPVYNGLAAPPVMISSLETVGGDVRYDVDALGMQGQDQSDYWDAKWVEYVPPRIDK